MKGLSLQILFAYLTFVTLFCSHALLNSMPPKSILKQPAQVSPTITGTETNKRPPIPRKASTVVKAQDLVAKGPNTNSVTTQHERIEAVQEEAKKKVDPRKLIADARRKKNNGLYNKAWYWSMGFWTWLLFIHATGIYFFTKGFLLTRLVLNDHSVCQNPPSSEVSDSTNDSHELGTPHSGCWHPKTFEKAVIIIIDALRYDFTVPFNSSDRFATPQLFHNALPFLYETAVNSPQNAFLLPFIADPPTTTLQRLKGLTTGTLPTFIDAGSNFAGTAIEEDNLLKQLRDAKKKMVHLGDDTWTALFPGYFEPNISRAYDSLNVWDLHTLDNGVIEHIMPLLESEKGEDWDVMFAHFLGVDHAGHRYGPSHPAMAAKLQQMDSVLRDIVKKLDEETLLVVMGDHGMDSKGDHGGESDDEVEAALWMYSKKGVFGTTDPNFAIPPQTAKERPVNQIDLVPTLALLLGLPIPFNNLGSPIREAFIGKHGNSWSSVAAVARITAEGVRRYQTAYYQARGLDNVTLPGFPGFTAIEDSRSVADQFAIYQQKTLEICKSLWARFDVPSMIQGLLILAAGVVVLILYAHNVAEEVIIMDPELERMLQEAEAALAADDLAKGKKEVEGIAEADFTDSTVTGAMIGTIAGGFLGITVAQLNIEASILNDFLLGSAMVGVLGALVTQIGSITTYGNPFPKSIWNWLAFVFTISQSIGFASNSYTIWEDSILLCFLSTFGIVAAVAAARKETLTDRTLSIVHAVLFVLLGWLASFSQLCREEQMPFCRSTYYASATSSTSAPWQLLIPMVVVGFLPSIIKSYYTPTLNYFGYAPLWISIAFRSSLFIAAMFWLLDAADDAEWFPFMPKGALKNARVVMAQTVFALSLAAGTIAFAWAIPCISITTTSAPPDAVRKTPVITVLGFGNAHGSRYFLLVTSILLACLLVQKPMGWLSLSLCTWQILSLFEIIDRLNLKSLSIGPIILAHLANFHFFKTGHQATLASIQWESAFVPLHRITYPWSPMLVILNTFGAHILCTAAVPLIILWKLEARQEPKVLMGRVMKSMAYFTLFFAVEGLATTLWAGHLRRHLMLYRIFSPRWMVASAVLLTVDAVGLLINVAAKINGSAVAEVFGWG